MLKSGMFMFAASFAAAAAAGDAIRLPPPQRDGGIGVFSALNRRQSSRNFSGSSLSEQELSNLLWAGFGINRADGRRTAPSAVNRQEYTLYAILAGGAFRYLPESGSMEKLSDEDLRPLVSGNVSAPAYILLVADMEKTAGSEYAAMDAGYISQNIYLAATAQNLGSCAIGSFKRSDADLAALRTKLKLTAAARPMLSQAVGKLK